MFKAMESRFISKLSCLTPDSNYLIRKKLDFIRYSSTNIQRWYPRAVILPLPPGPPARPPP